MLYSFLNKVSFFLQKGLGSSKDSVDGPKKGIDSITSDASVADKLKALHDAIQELANSLANHVRILWLNVLSS